MTQSNQQNNSLNEMLSLLESKELADTLTIMRHPIIKLSESNISKPLFNQWKKEGLIHINNDVEGEKHWNRFSLMEIVLLNIIKVLWTNDIDIKKIKDVILVLLDGKGLRATLDDILESNALTNQSVFENSPHLDMLHYIVSQKKQNPNIAYFTNIESYIIGSLKVNRPFNILIYDDGKIELFTTDAFKDMLGSALLNQMLQKSFLNVSIGNIVKEILSPDKDSNKIFTTHLRNDLIEKLLRSGYNVGTIHEIFDNNNINNLKYDEEVFNEPKGIHIENMINEKANQDIIIKVRDNKKKSIRRITITKE